MAATIEELGRVGYAEMRVDQVAECSGVNKTTIYRRWRTKPELVTAAFLSCIKLRPPIDTGNLRDDLRATLLDAFSVTPSERGLLRIMQMERSVPGVDTVARQLRDAMQAMRVDMVRRGIERGELPHGVDVELVIDLVSAPLQRALLFNETVEPGYVDRILDVVLAGAAMDAGKAPAQGRSRTGPKGSRRKKASTATKRKRSGGAAKRKKSAVDRSPR